MSSQILVHIISHCDVCSSPCPRHLQIFTARSLSAVGARLFNAFKSYSKYCTVSRKLCSWMSGCSLMVKKTLKSWTRPCLNTHRTWEIALPRSMLFLSLHASITCVYTRGQNITISLTQTTLLYFTLHEPSHMHSQHFTTSYMRTRWNRCFIPWRQNMISSAFFERRFCPWAVYLIQRVKKTLRFSKRKDSGFGSSMSEHPATSWTCG